MSNVNGEAGFSQLSKLNVTEKLLVKGEPVKAPSDMVVDRLLDGESVALNQQPSGTGDANKMQIEFGPAVNDGTDPVQLLVDGTILFNEAGTYRIKVAVKYGREGASGTAIIALRALVNGAQVGRSIAAKISSSNELIPFEDVAWLTVPAGVAVTYEIARDPSGNDSGGIYSGELTLSGWNEAPSASIRVERFA